MERALGVFPVDRADAQPAQTPLQRIPAYPCQRLLPEHERHCEGARTELGYRAASEILGEALSGIQIHLAGMDIVSQPSPLTEIPESRMGSLQFAVAVACQAFDSEQGVVNAGDRTLS